MTQPDRELREKTCTVCGVTKPLEDFSPRPTGTAGRKARCKPCMADANRPYTRKYRERHIEIEREKDRIAARAKKSKRNPEHERSRKQLRNAIVAGLIEKPEACEDCGQEIEPRLLHGHHEDYSRPLDVEWLCAGCHGKRHRKPDEVEA